MENDAQVSLRQALDLPNSEPLLIELGPEDPLPGSPSQRIRGGTTPANQPVQGDPSSETRPHRQCGCRGRRRDRAELLPDPQEDAPAGPEGRSRLSRDPSPVGRGRGVLGRFESAYNRLGELLESTRARSIARTSTGGSNGPPSAVAWSFAGPPSCDRPGAGRHPTCSSSC